jgi:transaldolase
VKYFLDSAIVSEIEYAWEHWGIDGVTTNPRHILNSGKPFHTVIREIAAVFAGVRFPISVEIDPHLDTAEAMIEEAVRIASISENFVIKLACTEQGLAAARKLKREGIETNVTLVFSTAQAIQAGRIGARFVSPFIAWKEANGEDCGQFIREVTTVYRNYGYSTEIIIAAVRTAKQIVEAAVAGAHIVTAGYQVFLESFAHPFTDRGIELFTDAWDKTTPGE